ncbi:MAG TPA: serine hydrolase [Streptosporangiaceae bacterium]|nr:serine hydrolase [Streptosporangiaceae bacterium]
MVAGLLTAGVTAGLAVAPSASALASTATTSGQICVSKGHPHLAARLSDKIRAAIQGRQGAIGLAAADSRLGLTCAFNSSTHFHAASVIKATIISALLLKKGGVGHLSASDRALAWRMITESDNDAANALWNETGRQGLEHFLNRARMTHTVLDYQHWGLSGLTAHDELTLLKLLSDRGRVLSAPSRRYVLYLMAHVEQGQRWGVTEGAPAKVTVHVKNGWLPDPSLWEINSIGVFTGKGITYQIAMLTSGNPTMQYGIDTIQGACKYLNWNLAAF